MNCLYKFTVSNLFVLKQFCRPIVTGIYRRFRCRLFRRLRELSEVNIIKLGSYILFQGEVPSSTQLNIHLIHQETSCWFQHTVGTLFLLLSAAETSLYDIGIHHYQKIVLRSSLKVDLLCSLQQKELWKYDISLKTDRDVAADLHMMYSIIMTVICISEQRRRGWFITR